MKKFNFRLEKLLVIREYQELEAKIKYASELQKQSRPKKVSRP